MAMATQSSQVAFSIVLFNNILSFVPIATVLYHCLLNSLSAKCRQNPSFIRSSKIVFREYLESWLNDYCQPNLSPRTNELYSYMCGKHIIPDLGDIPLLGLKPQHLQRLYASKIKSSLSTRTVQLIHVTLHKALKNAVKTRLVIRNIEAGRSGSGHRVINSRLTTGGKPHHTTS